ncbi:MAG: Zn-ribbon domain-containing OB-fold protein [Chloroflexi bacterium]|nr:Zn-ribbon domain-containing OB-fold protein [Chloroflexota bacterium]
MDELLRAEIPMELKWRFGTGHYFSRFIQALREEKKILGVKCPQCQKVYLPPRPICGNCYREMTEWVQVKDTGVIQGYTVYYHPIIDPVTCEPRPVPFGMALIKLDGADSDVNHYLSETDLTKLHIGMRVRAVWRPIRRGFISDISHFEVIVNEKD